MTMNDFCSLKLRNFLYHTAFLMRCLPCCATFRKTALLSMGQFDVKWMRHVKRHCDVAQ